MALSVVGTQKLGESGYFRAKIAQEQLIVDSGLPYSIVHATQFFEFIKQIAQAATHGDEVRLPPAPDPADGRRGRRDRRRSHRRG